MEALDRNLTISISCFAYDKIASALFSSYAHFEKVFALNYSSSGNLKSFLLVFPCRRTRLYLHRSSAAGGGPARPN